MTWQGNDLTKHKAIYSPATGWITRTIKQVCPYRCKSVSRHWSFNLLLANVAAKKGSTYLNFLSSCKPISRPFFCLALALHPSSFFHDSSDSTSVFYIGCGQTSRVARVALLEQELYEIDGESSGAIATPGWRQALSTYPAPSAPPPFLCSLFLLYLSCHHTARVPPPHPPTIFFILQSHMITALQVQRIKGFKGHKLIWVNFLWREPFLQERKTWWER